MRELNQQVQATTVAADDGSLSVFVGSQALVLGNSAAPVTLATAGDGGTSKLTIKRGALTSMLDDEHARRRRGGRAAALPEHATWRRRATASAAWR